MAAFVVSERGKTDTLRETIYLVIRIKTVDKAEDLAYSVLRESRSFNSPLAPVLRIRWVGPHCVRLTITIDTLEGCHGR